MTDNPYPPNGVPRVAGSDTSEAAANSLSGSTLNRLESQVFTAIASRGAQGVTDDELELMTGLRHQTVSARRRTLVLKQLICDSERRRPTRSGRPAVVWIVRAGPKTASADDIG